MKALCCSFYCSKSPCNGGRKPNWFIRWGKKKLYLQYDIVGCLCYGCGSKSQRRSVDWWGSSLPKIMLEGEQQGGWRDEVWSWGCAAHPWASWLLGSSHTVGKRLFIGRPQWSQCTFLLGWNAERVLAGEMAQGTEKHVSGPDRSSLLQKLPAKSIFAPCRCCLSVHQAIATAFWHSWKCRSSSVMGNSSPSPGDQASLWGWGTLLWVRIGITPGEGNQGHVWFTGHSPGPKAENSIFSCGWVA